MHPLHRTVTSLVLLVIFLTALLGAHNQTWARSGEVTHHYDWLTAGEVSGSLVVSIADDGTRSSDFEKSSLAACRQGNSGKTD